MKYTGRFITLTELLKFEFTKRWKASRNILMGYVLLQSVLLFLSNTFLWNGNMIKVFTENNYECQNAGAPSVIAMLLFFLAALLIGLYPIFEGVTRFNEDLSGRQSVLELLIPIASWKKLVAKVTTVLVNLVVGLGLSAVSITSFILLSSRFDKGILDLILGALRSVFASPGLLLLYILYILFCIASMYLIIYFCIAFSKVFSHKSKVAVLIGMVMFVAIITILGFLNDFMLQFPIIRFNLLGEDSLSSVIVSVMVMIAALFGTSWLIDHKIEY